MSQLSFAIAQNRVTLHLAELIVKFLVVGVVSLLFLFALARTRCPLSISTVTFTQEFLHRFPLIFNFTTVTGGELLGAIQTAADLAQGSRLLLLDTIFLRPNDYI